MTKSPWTKVHHPCENHCIYMYQFNAYIAIACHHVMVSKLFSRCKLTAVSNNLQKKTQISKHLAITKYVTFLIR